MGRSAFSDLGLDRVERVVARHVERGSVPGAVWLVAHGDEVHVGVVGTPAVDATDATSTNDPLQRDAIFRISSMTKPITAVAALSCVEDGLFRLEEPVDRLLPELADRRVLEHEDAPLSWTVPARRPILVRDLLTFTMGLGIVMAPPGSCPLADALVELQLGQGPPAPAVAPEPDEWLRRLGSLPLLHHPGEQWAYNTGADVVGVLIARATGQPFETALRERVLDPLGMHDTGFWVPSDRRHRLVTGYLTDPSTGELRVHDRPDGQWSRPPAFPSAAGGLVSTVDDYHAFARMVLAHGRGPTGRVLSRASVEAMTSDQLLASQRHGGGLVDGWFDSHGWGYGVGILTRRTGIAGSVGAYGWDGGLGTAWLNDPREELVTILLTQAAWTSPEPPAVCSEFRTAAYAALAD
jgi:CubicO group peptidase (beta-lactamase class C family)